MIEKPVQEEHERWEDLLIEVLDGRSDPTRRAELAAHLGACAECRAAAAEYTTLFARLADARQREPAAFWDGLAAEIDRRVAEAAAAPAGGVIDLRERARFGGGWGGVKGGLIAAGMAILLLIGLYLELPRTAGTPQAFITAPRRAPIAGPLEPGAAERLAGRSAAEGVEDAALAALAAGVDGAEYGSIAAELQDPLADLAEAELALEGLTPEEAEELLRSLESRT